MKGTLQISVHLGLRMAAVIMKKEAEINGLDDKELEGCLEGYARSKVPGADWQWDDTLQLVWYLDKSQENYVLCSFQ